MRQGESRGRVSRSYSPLTGVGWIVARKDGRVLVVLVADPTIMFDFILAYENKFFWVTSDAEKAFCWLSGKVLPRGRGKLFGAFLTGGPTPKAR